MTAPPAIDPAHATAEQSEAYWEGLSPRERMLYDLVHTGIAAALRGDEARAARIVTLAWQQADRHYPRATD